MAFEKEDIISIISSISDLVDSGQINSLSKGEIIGEVLGRINNLKYSENKNSVKIPVVIFSTKLSGLESLVKYLREELSWTFRRISEELNRGLTTISTSYFNSKKKFPERFNLSNNSLNVLLSDLSKRPLSVSEALVYSLKEKGHRYVHLSKLLKRNQRNIWSTYDRAKKKIEGGKNGK